MCWKFKFYSSIQCGEYINVKHTSYVLLKKELVPPLVVSIIQLKKAERIQRQNQCKNLANHGIIKSKNATKTNHIGKNKTHICIRQNLGYDQDQRIFIVFSKTY